MARVLMFGSLQDFAGWRERQIEAASLEGLRALLAAEDPALGERLSEAGVFTVVNKVMVRGEEPLCATDEVAFVPPVSGG